MKTIKVKGNVDKGRELIVRYKAATLGKWKGFESQLAMLTKRYARV